MGYQPGRQAVPDDKAACIHGPSALSPLSILGVTFREALTSIAVLRPRMESTSNDDVDRQ